MSGGDPIPYFKVANKRLVSSQKSALLKVAQYLPKMHVFDQPHRTVGQIKAASLAHGKPDVVLVDFLTKMSREGLPDWMRGDQQLGAICDRLRAFAKAMDCAVVVLCQLSRAYMKRENPVPQLSDLRDSGEIEQFADAVWFCHRKAFYLERKIHALQSDGERVDRELLMELEGCRRDFHIIVAKQRMGPLGAALLNIDITTNHIWDPQLERSDYRRAA